MKKFYLYSLLTSLLLLCSTVASAHDFKVNGVYYNVLSEEDKTVAVTYAGLYSGVVADEYTYAVVIPATVTYNNITYSVRSIGYGAFAGCTSLTYIEIPNSVTTIQDRAFNGCTFLSSITIPNSVTSIGNYAFYLCDGLKSVTIGNSVTSIGDAAFEYCSGLTSVTVDEGNSVYDSRGGCNAIIETATNTLVAGCKKTIIPNSVTSIGEFAFRGCTGLTSVTIPNSVTSIGDWAFNGCSSLTSITIPNSVTTIGGSAFRGCTGLTSVTIGNGVHRIGEAAFQGCTALKDIYAQGNIPALLDSEAFAEHYASATLHVPAGTKAAYQSSTSQREEMEIKMLPVYNNDLLASMSGFDKDAEYETVKVEAQNPDVAGTLNGSDYLLAYQFFKTKLTDLPKATFETSIARNGRYKIALVTVPWFIESYSDTLIRKTTDPQYADSYLRVRVKQNNEQLAMFPCDSFNIGTSNTNFGVWEKHAIVPDRSRIDTIFLKDANNEDYIFDFVNNHSVGVNIELLRPLQYNEGNGLYTAKNANRFAFRFLLDQIMLIPVDESTIVSTIYWKNFNNIVLVGEIVVDGLSYAVISEEEKTVQVIGYSGSNEFVKIPSSITKNGNTYSVTSIGEGVFSNCTGLTSVTIPNSVTSIGESAFAGCTGLTSIEIPNSVTSVGNYAFNGCTGIKNVRIEDGDTKLNLGKNGFKGLFYYCPLESLYLGRNLNYSEYYGDGYSPFALITTLTSVTIGDNVNSLNTFLFKDCSNLNAITIPESVQIIEDYVFQYCDLREIHIPASVESIGDYAFTWNLNLQGITMDSGNKVYNIPANSNVIMRGDSVVFGWQGAVIPENAVAIGNGAFNSVKGITSITIPASVTSIGEWAFEACSDLTEIYCLSETPARIYSTTFQGLYGTVTLYVPAGSKAAYQAVNYWKNFTNIVEIIVPGDIDVDGTVDVADVTALVGVILNGEETEETPTEQTFEDWTSTNAGVSSSTSQNSYTLEAAEGSVLTFDWSVSSESNYDWLIITIDGTQILRKSGSYTGSYEHTFTTAGTHTLVAKYTKDGSVNNGSDQGKIYNIKLSGSASSKNNSTADVDGDGTVDVADVTSLVNIILFGNKESDDTAGETIGIPQDLGLSVKWASYNVGAIAAWESGDYYAWGETEEKEEYSQSTYKFSGSSGFGQFTKYYYDNTLGLGGDGKTKLDYEDDVARVKWGGSWRMPTNGELDELRDNCTWEWETLYGVKGYRVTGPNGNSIFLPAVGFRTGTEINSQQKIYYWSSTVYVIGGYTDAYIIDETYAGDDYFFDAVCGRYCGLPVRPVCE